MKKKFLLFALFSCTLFYSQVGIGIDSPDKSAMLDVVSTTKGVLVPRMTTTERDAIVSPANALTIFNLSEQCYNYYDLPSTVWKSLCAGGSATPTVTALTCGSATITGNVIAGQPVSGATLIVPYTGGNGASYSAGTPVAVSGGTVTGLTLTLQAGNLAIGAGSLVYTISGTPSGAGTAVFTLPFGGKTCTDATVTATAGPSATALTCSSATQSGTLTVGTPASGVTFTVLYSGGNGTPYSAGAGIASTGVLGLTATLVPGTLNTGSGTLTYNVTGTPFGSGLANFNLTFGGTTCTGASVTVLNSTSSALYYRFATGASFNNQVTAICPDGSVKSQGGNTFGQRGTGTNASTPSGATSTLSMLIFGPSYPAVSVVTGQATSAVLSADGYVWVAGSDSYGELGQNVVGGGPYYTPVKVQGPGGTGFLNEIVQIFAGNYAHYAIKSDGTGWSWGKNTYGILGDGTTVNKAVPVQIKGPGGVGFLTGIKEISSSTADNGQDNTTAVLNNGTVYSWGSNGVGQLGNGTTTQSSTPVQVKGVGGVGFLTNVKTTANAQGTNCYLLNDGTVYVTGQNLFGLLGQNSASPSTTTTPLQVKGVGGVGFLTGIVDIKANYYNFMALKNDGTVYTWGNGLNHTLGNNSTADALAPVQVVGVGGTGFLTGIVEITGGHVGSAALDNNGVLYGWGVDNGNNSLAPTITTNQDTPVVLSNFCKLPSMPTSTFALTCTATQTGTLTVGTAASGVSFTVPYTGGNGTAYTSETGIASSGITGLTATLVPGTLANGSGTLTYNVTGTPSGSGQASFAISFNGSNCTGASVTVINATIPSANDNFTFSGFVGQNTFAICQDGSVLDQGYNSNGELGTGNTTATASGAISAFNMLGFDSGNKAIGLAAGNEHTLILKVDGTVWATGKNDNGALGQNTVGGANVTTPVQVKGPGGVGFLTDVVKISAGLYSSFAIKSDGTSWAWGNNDLYQLGDGTNTARYAPVQIKGAGGIGFFTGADQIATAEFQEHHTCILKNDGTVFCTGSNNVGQLGDGTTVSKNVPTQVLESGGVGFLSNVKAIAVSRQGSCAVLNDGTVYAWGYNTYGEIGQNTSGPTTFSKPTQVKGLGGSGFLTGIVDVKSTMFGYIALKSDGTVYSWGFGGYGSNGDGTTTQRNAPVQVVGVGGVGFLTGITAIQGGYLTCGALGSNGVIYGWGKNDYNGLAPTISPTGNQTTPVALTNFCTVK